MRYLILILLALNVAYFSWSYLSPVEGTKSVPPPRSDGVHELVLLSERQSVAPVTNGDGVGAEQLVSEGIGQASEVAPVTRCFTLGPLLNEKDKDVLLARLTDMGFKAESRSIEQRETTGYWVFLPPSKNRKEALALAESLASKGIKDYYVVTDKEYRHAVSLGLFSEKGRANRRMAHIRTLGFKPQKTVRYRDRTYYWLDYVQNKDGQLPDAVWKEMDSKKEKIQKLDRSCN
jgi:hypothetical protein